MAKTKGFRFGRKGTATIDFAADHPLHGLEIEVELKVPVGVALAAQRGDMQVAVPGFAKRVVSWNVEGEDGQPLPPTVESVCEQLDFDDLVHVLKAWMDVVAQPSPLPEAG